MKGVDLSSCSEVKFAITGAKQGKTIGLSRVVADTLKASGNAGEQWVSDL